MHLWSNYETVHDAQNLFFLSKSFVKHNNLTEDSQDTYARHIKIFLKSVPESIANITLEHIEREIVLYSKNVKANTANAHICIIKSFFQWLYRNGHCTLQVGVGLLPTPDLDQRVLSKQEYAAVLEKGTRQYMLDIFTVLCNTGMRAKEFLSLTPDNFKADFARVSGKGRKNRSIPLNKTVKEVIARDPELSFISGSSRHWLHWVCTTLAKEAKIPPFHPHSCRHYFATELHYKGVPIATISRLLGHKSTATTEIVYVHWSEESLKGTTDVLD